MTTRPRLPIGLRLTRTAKVVAQAFDAALADAGGSLPVWIVLLALKTGQADNQRELAESVGIQGPTLTHHLNAMETDGLLTRRRDTNNRRIHRVELTDKGERLFLQLRNAAVAFDRRLRTGITESELSQLTQLLDRFRENVVGNG